MGRIVSRKHNVLLMITSDFPPVSGGQSRYLYDLWGCLPGSETVVLAPKGPGDREVDEGLACEVIRVRLPFGDSRLGKVVKPFRLMWKAWKLCRRFRVIGVHSGQVFSAGFAAYSCTLFKGIPYYPYVHGADLMESRDRLLWGWLLRCILGGAQKVIVNSRFTAEAVEKVGVEARSIQVVHPSIDLDRFANLENSEEIRERRGWTGRCVVLTIGRLVERKGQDMIIRALPQVVAEIPDIHYVIGGAGPDRERLERLAVEQGVAEHVEFAGFVPESQLVEMYAAADVFAMVSRELPERGDVEGFGIVFLEANAAGIPVLAGRSGGIGDAVIHDQTGLLVNPEDVNQIAAELIRLFQDADLRSRLGSRGRERVWREFDRKIWAKRLWETCR